MGRFESWIEKNFYWVLGFFATILMCALVLLAVAVPKPKQNSCDCGSICSTSSHCELKECPKHKTADEPLSNKQLQSWYDGLNEEYFMNRLPRASVTWGDLTALNDMGATMHPEDGFVIIIDRKTNPTTKTAEATVAHELCHVATWGVEFDAHGPKFQSCMVNLANKGAFEGVW
jgi:hypothetical protein